MDSTVQLDRNEWEAFLEKLSELEKKYQLVLRELDEAQSKLQALENPRDEQEKKVQNPTVTEQEQPAQRTDEPKKIGFLAALETKLRSRRIHPAWRNLMGPGAPLKYASCSRCGRQIVHATRFCDRCGADFGEWVCSCGRGLSDSARFCDRCGQKVEDAIQRTG